MTDTTADTSLNRLPPHDIEAEMCALGSAMLSPDAAGQVTEELREQDFFRPAHKTVWQAIADLYARGETVNPVSVRAQLATLNTKTHTPDGIYIHGLVERVPAVSSTGWYIRRLQNLTKVRGLAMAGHTISRLGHTTEPDDADQAVDHANKTLDEATRVAGTTDAKPVAELITPFIEHLEDTSSALGVTTGLTDLDAVLSRLRPGQLITVGARQGIGKSVLMVTLAHHVGMRLGQPVLVSTLEMSATEYMARLVALDAQVNLKSLLDKNLTEADWARIADSYKRLSCADTVLIDDTATIGVAGFRANLRAMRRRSRPAALAIIDYLQLMSSGKRVENRQVEVSEFSRALKILAKEFEVPVVVGSQLNRNVEHRQDRKPYLADLRESGSIEQDSDVVILAHREDAYDPESPRAGEIDLLVEKNRNGPKGTVTAVFQGHYSRVVNFAAEPWSPTRGMP